MGLGYQTGPQFGLGENSKVRAPVIEEPADERERVERDELVDAAGRQTGAENVCGGDGAGGDKEAEIRVMFTEAADDFEERKRLADRGGVEPDQGAFGARLAGFAAPFGHPFGMLFSRGKALFQNLFPAFLRTGGEGEISA